VVKWVPLRDGADRPTPVSNSNRKRREASTPVLREATHEGQLPALLRRSQIARRPTALDPLLPFKIDPMNGR
jgi:hypothetical protein